MQYSTSTEYSGFRSVSHVGYRTLSTSAPPHHASYHTIPYHTIPSMHHSMHHTIHASYHTIPYHTIPCMHDHHASYHPCIVPVPYHVSRHESYHSRIIRCIMHTSSTCGACKNAYGIQYGITTKKSYALYMVDIKEK